MSEEENSTTNTAEHSTVGIQAQTVHNSNIYVESPEDPPEKRYSVGVRYLDNGMPSRARDLIADAIARNYDTAEVRFHWVLALLSNRSYRELGIGERTDLARLPVYLAAYPEDEWKNALEALSELLKYLDCSKHDPAPALNKLQDLPAEQRDKIARHCDRVLTGGIKDSLWKETLRAAKEGQHAGDRTNRAWAYFHPKPAYPRKVHPDPAYTNTDDWLRGGLATGILVVTLGSLGWTLFHYPTMFSVLAYAVGIACGVVAVKSGFDWGYNEKRLAAKERDFTRVGHHDPPQDGFAKRVGHDFEYFAHRDGPKGTEQSAWLADSRGIRNTLRNQIVELYREQRVEADEVRWLIRYLLRELSNQWQEGALFSYRERYRTPVSTKARCLSSLAIAILGVSVVVDSAFQVSSLQTVSSVALAAVSGRAAAIRWWRICSERRRITEEDQESEYNLEARRDAYRRWKSYLDSTCPTEHEMAAWLECDKICLINQALEHYRLAWRDIVAHTVVQTPAQTRLRARVERGPWRYPKYNLRLFLITADGVREVNRQLDFKNGTFQGDERGHFRFDALSSLQVTRSGNWNYTLTLTLTNGSPRTIDTTEPQLELEHSVTDEPNLSEINLDASGFAHALYVLEGITAEGKAWIYRSNSPGATDLLSR